MISPDHILPYLYNRGVSATLVLTRSEEHKSMGLIHPKTGETYVYRTLPMGTRNSPGASGRFGAALIRLVVETSDLFSGTPVDNSLQPYFTKRVYHPIRGEGRVLICPDSVPSVLIWLHVDNILIHSPTWSKFEASLDHIILATVKLGLICHPSKASPPRQCVNYCGFEYDTSSVPTLRILQNKVSRAIAITNYLCSGIKAFFHV